MAKPHFHKEMSTYIEVRKSFEPKRSLRHYCVLQYKCVMHVIKNYVELIKDFIKPQRKLIKDLVNIDASKIHIFDREKSLFQRAKKAMKKQEEPDQPEDIDVALIEQTVKDYSVDRK